VDFHAYVNNTGWLEPKPALTSDSARLFAEYDRAALAAGFAKPVIWGELGIDGTTTTDEEEPQLAEDADGVWLHKLTWARLGPGGVTPLYWYTDNIDGWELHPIFGAWRRFMAGIPLTNGRYVDAGATSSTANPARSRPKGYTPAGRRISGSTTPVTPGATSWTAPPSQPLVARSR
jgi:hypothetical protein